MEHTWPLNVHEDKKRTTTNAFFWKEYGTVGDENQVNSLHGNTIQPRLEVVNIFVQCTELVIEYAGDHVVH